LRFWERVSCHPEKWIHRRFDLDVILRGERNKKRIQEAVNQKMSEVNKANNAPPTAVVPTVTEFVANQLQAYLKSKSIEVKQSSVEVRARITEKHIVGSFGERRLDEITVDEMTGYFASLKDRYSVNYRNAIWALWKGMFEAAVDMEIVKASPLRPSFHRPKGKKTRKPQLSSDQIITLLRCIPDDFRVLSLVIAVTSMRIGEILALNWVDFDESKGSLNIAYTLTKGKREDAKTEESKKVVEIPVPVVAALRIHRMKSAYTRPQDFIFCLESGAPLYPWYALRKIMRPALEGAGIERVPYLMGFHLFRRSCAKLLYELCRDSKMVQEYLRHSNISTTMGYIGEVDHVRGEATKLISDKLNIALLVPQEVQTIQ
jgi:integrase